MPACYPISLALAGCDCLIVGGGTVAWRKASALVACGAHVRVVSPRFCREIHELEGLRLVQRHFEEQDVVGASLVFAATSDPGTNRLVARAARRHRAWVNVVDTPQECDFIVPASVRRGALSVSVSTGGASPALARRIRQQLEDILPESYGAYVALLAELRPQVIERVADPPRRRTILRRLAEEETWTLFDTQGPDAVRQLVGGLVEEAT